MRLEFRKGRKRLVPRAGAHALFATEAPAVTAFRIGQILRQRLFRLDGQVGNTTAGVQVERSPQRTGRAGPQTSATGTALRDWQRSVGCEPLNRYIADNHTDQDPQAIVGRDEEIVLADESQPGLDGPVAFQDWRAVDERPAGEGRELRLQNADHCVQPVFHDFVIVHALGKAGDAARRLPVRGQETKHAFCTRNQLPRVQALVHIPRQIGHFPVIPVGQVLLELPAKGFRNSRCFCSTEIQETIYTFVDFY